MAGPSLAWLGDALFSSGSGEGRAYGLSNNTLVHCYQQRSRAAPRIISVATPSSSSSLSHQTCASVEFLQSNSVADRRLWSSRARGGYRYARSSLPSQSRMALWPRPSCRGQSLSWSARWRAGDGALFQPDPPPLARSGRLGVKAKSILRCGGRLYGRQYTRRRGHEDALAIGI